MSSALFARTVAAAHAAFGVDAVYHPPSGPSVPGLRVIVDASAEPEDVAGARLTGSRRRVVEVMAADVASPAKDGRFALGEGSAVIVAVPVRKDADALVWSCVCRLDP